MANFSRLNDHLYIGKTPKQSDWEILISYGIKLVINMRLEKKTKVPKQLINKINILWLPSIDLYPITISVNSLNKGVKAALEIIKNGGSVLVHCRQGRHRSVAMAAAILIAQGMPTEDAMMLIKKYHPSGDPYAKHITRSIEKFAAQYDKKPN